MSGRHDEEMVEVVIDSIRVSLVSQQRIVILREVGADRYLPIWIGPFEAESITIALQDVEVARPLTHDLLFNLFRALNARVIRVEITSLKEEVYYGNIVAEVNGLPFNLDSRPSDALALSVRAHVPILVSTKVMDSVGIIPEENLEKTTTSKPPSPAAEPPAEGHEDRLSVFEDFLDKLDLGGSEDEEDDADKA